MVDFVPFVEDGSNVHHQQPTLIASGSVALSSELAATAYESATRKSKKSDKVSARRRSSSSEVLDWCKQSLSTSLRVPVVGVRSGSTRRSKHKAGSEVQMAIKWSPGAGAAASKFVGWLRVALMQIDGLPPSTMGLTKAIRVRASGSGLRTLDTKNGRLLPPGHQRSSANFFAVQHHGSAIPTVLPTQTSSTSIAWPAGDGGFVQLMVMDDGAVSDETSLVLELWGRRTNALYDGNFGHPERLTSSGPPSQEFSMSGPATANVLIGFGKMDLSHLLRPWTQTPHERKQRVRSADGTTSFQVQLQSVDKNASSTCHFSAVFQPAGPADMKVALLKAAEKTPAKKTRALGPDNSVRSGKFGLSSPSPDRQDLLRKAAMAGAEEQFSLSYMRNRLKVIKPEECLKHCQAIDQSRTGRVSACDFEIILQQCRLALSNAELAALYRRLDYSKTGSVDYQFFGSLMLGREFTDGVAKSQTPRNPKDNEKVTKLMQKLLRKLEQRATQRRTTARNTMGAFAADDLGPTLEQAQSDVEAEVHDVFATYDRTGAGVMSERVFGSCLSMVFADAILPADVITLLAAYRSAEDPGCADYPQFLSHLFQSDAHGVLRELQFDQTSSSAVDEHQALQRIRYWLWDVGTEEGVNTGAASVLHRRGGPAHSYAGGVAESRSLELVRLKRQQPTRLPALRDAFQLADINNSGRLTRVQFRRALSGAGAPVADSSWPILLDAAVARSSEQQLAHEREEQRQLAREFPHTLRALAPHQEKQLSKKTQPVFDGFIDYELFIRTLLSGDRGQGGRGGGLSMTSIRARILDAVYSRLRDLVGNGRQALEHLFRSFDIGARATIPGGAATTRARFISKGDFAEALDLLVHNPNLEVSAHCVDQRHSCVTFLLRMCV